MGSSGIIVKDLSKWLDGHMIRTLRSFVHPAKLMDISRYGYRHGYIHQQGGYTESDQTTPKAHT